MGIMKSIIAKVSVSLVVGLCLSLLFVPMPGHATGTAYTYFVSPSGNDENNGETAETAFEHLHYAIGVINAIVMVTGDTFILNVASGTYSTTDNSEPDLALNITQSYLTIDGDDTDKPVIDGSGASYWPDGLTIAASNVVVKDLVLRNFAASSSGIKITGGSNNVVDNCEMHSNDYGVEILSPSNSNEIRNGCKIHNNVTGIYIYGSDSNLIHDNAIYDNESIGIHLQSYDAYPDPWWVSPDSNQIYGNTIYWTSSIASSLNGIQLSQDDWTFEGDANEIYENEFHGPTTNTTLHTAIYLYPGATNTKISRNKMHNLHKGIFSYYSNADEAAPQIVNNLIFSIQYGIYLETSTGAATVSGRVYHNTLADGVSTGITYNEGSPEIKYNIITGFDEYGIDELATSGAPVIDYNDVYGNGTNYANCDPGANDLNPPNGLDPLFTDPSSGDYTLQAGSPCINAIPIGDPPNDQVTEDKDGTPRPYGSGFDMGCYEKTTLPAVTTTAISAVTATTATSGGSVTSQGSSAVTAKGVCWSTSENPTSDMPTKTSNGSGTESFTSDITGLSPSTTYYVRAYATNSAGTGYGSQVSFTTSAAATPTEVDLTGPATVNAGTVSTAFTLTSQDVNGNPANVTQDTVFNLTSNTTGTASFYSDAAGTTVITQATIANGTSTVTFYYKDTAAGTPTITAATDRGMALGWDTHQITVNSGTAISGTVFESDGVTPITGTGITVHAYTGNPCTESHQWQGSADINPADGTYTIQGLPAGNNYYLETYTEAAYLNEYWAQNSSSPHCQNAGFFDLVEGQIVGGKDFQLDHEATISGTIFHGDGTTPLTETTVWVNVYSGDPCGDKEWIASACTNPPGSASYTVGKLVAGTYYLETGGQETYPNEWWADPNSTPDCQGAMAITVYEGDTHGDKDFQLDGPTITSFTPTSGGKGTVVVITGTNFTDATAVSFGGEPAIGFTVNSDTKITATVANGATGKVAVTKDGYTVTSAGDFTYNAVYPSVYWIDIQNGSDNNNGRQETPWGTIHNGILQINGGNPGTASSPYTLIVKIGGETHYSTGTGEPDSELVVSQDYVRIIGESGSGPVIDGAGAQMWTKGLTIEGSHVSVDNLYITNFSANGGMGIEFNSGSYNTVENCKLYGNDDGVNFGSTTSENTLRNCDIYQNNKGVVCYSNNKIAQNTIHNNATDGIFVENASPEIRRNAIYDNTYGICVNGKETGTASPLIVNNLIYKTATGAVHFGIHLGGSDTAAVNPKIYHNTMDGGTYEGILIEAYGTSAINPEIKYNIITNFEQYGIENSGGNPVIDYNDVWNNATDYSPANLKGANDISADPKFGSYTLRSDSPCIDAIRSDPPNPPPDDPVLIDYEGFKRPKGAGYDMGAYEYVASAAFNYTLPGGTGAATDYRIFTVPLDLGKGSNMLSQMEAVLSNYDPFHWRAFAYQGTSYLEFNSSGFADLDIKPGRGYWIITVYTDVIPFTGRPAPDGIDHRIVLSPGWHLIGLPWIDKKISLGNIYVSDWMNKYPITSQPTGMELTQECVWEYTGASGYAQRNSATYQLECGTGYWIKVVADHFVTLIIPSEDQAPEGPGDTVPEDLSSPSGSGEEPPPPPGAEPIPGVALNSPAGSMTAASGAPVSVAVTLDPGAWAGRDADWWMAAHTPFAAPYDWYSYVHPTGWRPGIHRCVKAPLFEIATPLEVLNMNLPAGRYTFYFAVDGNADGALDITWIDSVDVTVE